MATVLNMTIIDTPAAVVEASGGIPGPSFRDLIVDYLRRWLNDEIPLPERYEKPRGIDGRPTVAFAFIEPKPDMPDVELPGLRRTLRYDGAFVTLDPARGGVSLPGHVWRENTKQGKRGLQVLADIKLDSPHGDLLHVSLSYPHHNPSWNEIKAIRYAFFGRDEDVLQVLPADGDYVNDHPHCFHLWQCPERWGLRP